jgi:hypothetical protein
MARRATLPPPRSPARLGLSVVVGAVGARQRGGGGRAHEAKGKGPKKRKESDGVKLWADVLVFNNSN